MIFLDGCLDAADDFGVDDVDAADDLLHEFDATEREGISQETELLGNNDGVAAVVVVVAVVAVAGGGMTGMLVEADAVAVGGSVTEVGGFEMLTTEFSFCSSVSDTEAGVGAVVRPPRLEGGAPNLSHFQRPSSGVSFEKS